MTKQSKVFISYSHKDKHWLLKLQDMLKPLIRSGNLTVWDDTKIRPGTRWMEEINQELASAKVAILLVSHHFLASDFINSKELKPLLKKEIKGGVKIMWIYISSCLYEETKIANYQALHDISKPIESLTKANQNKVLMDICQKIKIETNS